MMLVWHILIIRYCRSAARSGITNLLALFQQIPLKHFPISAFQPLDLNTAISNDTDQILHFQDCTAITLLILLKIWADFVIYTIKPFIQNIDFSQRFFVQRLI